MSSKAYSEVYQLIQFLPEKEYKLIPRSQIDFIEENMDSNDKNKYKLSTKIEDINISLEAKTMLLTLFYLNIATDEQKQKLEIFLKKQEGKQSKDIYDNMFHKNKGANEQNKIENSEINQVCNGLIETNDTKLKYKIFNFFKKILKKLNLKK